MDILSSPLQYVIIFIGFLAIVFFISRLNKKLIENSVNKAKQENKLPELAEVLGMKYEELSSKGNKDEIFSIGSRLYGQYKGIPIEIIMKGDAQEASRLKYPYMYAFSYSSQKTITLTVDNKKNHKFHILPKDKDIVSIPSGHAKFDKTYSFIGDFIFPTDIIEYFCELGWMNLKLEGNKLIFNDTYYEQFSGMSGSLKMMNNTHPVWGTSLENYNIDIQRMKSFIDCLVEIANKINR